MEIAGGVKYDHKKEDCPYVLSLALQKKYEHIPKLGCMITNAFLMKSIKSGLKKHGKTLKQLYGSKKDYIDGNKLIELLEYLLHNKRDGFFVLEHNNPIETRHLFAFLYNHNHKTLDFFDSYNKTRTLYTMRMDSKNIKKFIQDVFDKYFKMEFVIEKLFEFK
jgi:flagellar motor component MotA